MEDFLTKANQRFQSNYPGESTLKQPIHTLYLGAQHFNEQYLEGAGQEACRYFETYLPDPDAINSIFKLQLDALESQQLYRLVKERLASTPIEDFRIDFEDGFGDRSDDEEDQAAIACAKAVRLNMRQPFFPDFFGIRIRAFTEDLRDRSARTAMLFMEHLLEAEQGVPKNFTFTLTKISVEEHIVYGAKLLAEIEKRFQLTAGSLKAEFMVETTQALMDENGRCPLKSFIEAGEGRIRGVHFGTYDFTAANKLLPFEQMMDHPVCDHAHFVMKTALHDTGVWLSDGATNVLPFELDGGAKHGVVDSWRLSFKHICHSLKKGLYQGWDLHPGQLPVRYLAFYYIFRKGLKQAAIRLSKYEKNERGTIADDAATAKVLRNFLLKGLHSGAFTKEELEFYGPSF